MAALSTTYKAYELTCFKESYVVLGLQKKKFFQNFYICLLHFILV
jgi:hypothetical protein